MRVSMRSFIEGYMSSRCRVSSQHKLPCFDELEQIADLYADWMDTSTLQPELDRMVREGKLFKYGPYYSDHEIDVL